ncbi:hypothetical protein [Frankia sp. Cr1]|nr:hypothetical protein [Frankia sp. Cr1]
MTAGHLLPAEAAGRFVVAAAGVDHVGSSRVPDVWVQVRATPVEITW